jgi:hypothetical protein
LLGFSLVAGSLVGLTELPGGGGEQLAGIALRPSVAAEPGDLQRGFGIVTRFSGLELSNLLCGVLWAL